MENLLIKNVSVVPMTHADAVIQNGYIYIEKGVINALGSAPNHTLVEKADRVIDGEHLVAMPGLINGHTHTPMSVLRGYAGDLPLQQWLQEIWKIEAKMSSEDIYWAAMLSMVEMLKSGTTTFGDMYYGMDKVAEGVQASGMRALLTQGIIEQDGHGEDVLAECVDFVKRWHGKAEGRIQAILSPHAPYTCSPQLIEKLVEAAHDLDCSIHTHLNETRGKIDTIIERYGKRPIVLMDEIGLFSRHVIAAHGVHVSEEELEILARSQAGIIHNPKSNMKLGSGIAPIADMLERGIVVGLGTDGSASNNVLDMFEEMRFASFLQKVHLEDPTALSAYETLKLGTALGAQALGIESEIGTLEVGKKADLTLVNVDRTHALPLNDILSHLIYSAKADDVDYTIVNGRVLYEKGHVVTLDEEKIKWHVLESKNKLFGS
ncbi:S-methyl-5'-thioadenosine deaminase [Lentibacillus sp. JNUCC-1]|uniref:amidohydrolase family protein n=1 Tax=Lentibacillus sp. JNUCC-1 TaxID=2654513 RepID=UPI0012E93C24|nr:amidohydrolase [Lentibacillus sp. JNUCC-1]MUV36968.1 S-methyl-5'-thioadenosine deaminase [Lentibacillus sp. JNUCC-1]